MPQKGFKRISVPSWIQPGTYLENIREVLASFQTGPIAVTGVELLFFMLDDETERIFMAERDAIASHTDRLSFSVHMPGTLISEHDRLIKATMDFCDTYVLHPPETDLKGYLRIVDDWRSRFGDRFLLENTIWGPFEETLGQLEDIPVCLDTGHAVLSGLSPALMADRFGGCIREIHFHGVAEGKDHVPPSLNDAWLSDFTPFLRTFDGILEIEVFSRAEIETTLGILAEIS